MTTRSRQPIANRSGVAHRFDSPARNCYVGCLKDGRTATTTAARPAPGRALRSGPANHLLAVAVTMSSADIQTFVSVIRDNRLLDQSELTHLDDLQSRCSAPSEVAKDLLERG